MSTGRRIRPSRVFALSAGAALVLTASMGAAGASADQAAPAASSAPSTVPAPMAVPSKAPSPMAATCEEGWLCVWDGPNGQGHRVDFYRCNMEDVRAYGLSRVGSYVNNQIDGTVATFKGPDESTPQGPWFDQYSSTAFAFNDDGTGFLTYGIQVC